MNVDSSKINQTAKIQSNKINKTQKNSSVQFSDELKDLSKNEVQEEKSEKVKNEPSEGVKEGVNEGVKGVNEELKEGANEEVNETVNETVNEEVNGVDEDVNNRVIEKIGKEANEKIIEGKNGEINRGVNAGVKKVVNEKLIKNINNKEAEEQNKFTLPVNDINKSLEELSLVVKEFNQSEENGLDVLKEKETSTDNTKKGEFLINNDFNIQDKKDILPQMNPNMNFSGEGQPFSSFMGNEKDNQNENLAASASDLAEEAAILSTMSENIAMANKNSLIQETEKTVNREEGIKKVDVKTGITIENIVKYDSIIMNEADVEVFTGLVENGEVNLDNLAPQAAKKSVQVSKTLADMLAKAKDTQQPLRIDFDNGISVIIKISRGGKISADFLPSTQVAEAYLKENLPLLKQRFDDSNLEYEELNRRERREQNREDNKKKGRRDE